MSVNAQSTIPPEVNVTFLEHKVLFAVHQNRTFQNLCTNVYCKLEYRFIVKIPLLIPRNTFCKQNC